MSPVRFFLVLSVVWTGVVVIALLVWPWALPAPGCWQIVDPPAGCLEDLARANDSIWRTQTLPMLAFFASGYVIVGLLAFRRRRRAER